MPRKPYKPSNNPKPKIGQEKKRYKFSKKFEKERIEKKREKSKKKVAEETKASQERKFITWNDELISLAEAEKRGILGSKVRTYRDDTSVIARIVILCNQYGISETANLLDIDEDTMDSFIQGMPMSEVWSRKLNALYYTATQENDDIDFGDIERISRKFVDAYRYVNEEDYAGEYFQTVFQVATAEGKITTENIEDSRLWRYLNAAQKKRIFDWIAEDDTADLNSPIEAFSNDLSTYGQIPDDIEESIFWEWFRDTFYPE